MTLRVGFRRAARDEFMEAAARYEDQRAGLGSEFITEVERCLDNVAEQPERYPAIYKSIRRATAQRFPYCIFRQENGTIIVLAIFHGSRNPLEWKRRV